MAARLADIARQLVADGKGILAADDFTAGIDKRLESAGISPSPEARRDFREILFGAQDAMRECISGVILYDETIRQSARNGAPLTDMILNMGALIGVKLDTGSEPLPFTDGELTTKGLETLAPRMAEYKAMGATFGKWRAIFSIGENRPSANALSANAYALARYASLCQEAGLVPIVEPDILMDGAHTIEDCREATVRVLTDVFRELQAARVRFDAMILKPNMVTAGKSASKQATHEDVARHTMNVLKRCVPGDVPGIAFLSGGQSSLDATMNLNQIRAQGSAPWKLTFSYNRALQADALKAWAGKDENIEAARIAFTHRARMNALASRGRWTKAQEWV
jgi:fructose-bisphosphate aldolase, class I